MAQTKPKVCVIGGGIIGLTTANILQEKIKEVDVRFFLIYRGLYLSMNIFISALLVVKILRTINFV